MTLCQSLKLYPRLLIAFLWATLISWGFGLVSLSVVNSVIFNISNTVNSLFIPARLYSYEEGC
ncbi:MAG: hypothetical protein ACJAW8_002262 [Oleispira sp.]|jgi:hypothetical protein